MQVSDRHEVVTSVDTDDDAWDAFLDASAGHHAQTSLWREVKGVVGWRGVRLVARNGPQIVGGVQVFIRRMPVVGAVGYAPGGPVVGGLDPEGVDALVESVQRAMAARHIRYLLFEPPAVPLDLERSLVARSFAPAAVRVGPRATLLLGLRADEDQLLQGMKPRTRYNVRLAARKEIVVREGSETDIPVFYELLQATGQRQGFSIYPEHYYRRLWDVLGSKGHAKLFVATYRDRPVAVKLAVAFGNTVTSKLTAWSGEHAQRKPNEALYWETIRWANAAGYELFDFEGIDASVARALADGRELTSDEIPSLTAFKLGFGGFVRVEPQAYEHVDGSVRRFVYRNTLARAGGHDVVRGAVNSLRTRGRPRLSLR